MDAALEAILGPVQRLQRCRWRAGSSAASSTSRCGGVVDPATVEEVVADLTKDSDDRMREALAVVSAYDHPRLCLIRQKSFYFHDDRGVGRRGRQGGGRRVPGQRR